MSADHEHAMNASFEGMIVEDAPNAVVASIVSAFVRSHAMPGPLTRALRSVRATLAFDGWLAPPTPALRSAPAASGPRHLVYRHDVDTGDRTDIAISLYPVADGDAIVGQVLTDRDGDEAPSVVEVLRASDLLAVAPVGPGGEFTVEVPTGWTELVVVANDLEIAVPAPVGGGAA